MATDEASKKFRRAEKRMFVFSFSVFPSLITSFVTGHHRPRIQYTYPPSPTDSGRNSPMSATPSLPLSQRLRRLEAELAIVETELQDPSNPLLQHEKDVDPGELVKRMVSAKRRLDKISKVKEGRGKLVSVILGEVEPAEEDEDPEQLKKASDDNEEKEDEDVKTSKGEVKDITEMDRRVGELEKIVGSSSATLDEVNLDILITLVHQSAHYFVEAVSFTTATFTTFDKAERAVNFAHPTSSY